MIRLMTNRTTLIALLKIVFRQVRWRQGFLTDYSWGENLGASVMTVEVVRNDRI